MSDTSIPAPGKRRWVKILGLAAGGFVVLAVALYFTLTSAAFLKGVVLPRVSAALHATVTVEDASLSPFSNVSLKGLKVVTKDGAPLLKADEVRTGYSLMGMLGGTIKVDEVRVVNATVEVTATPDGRSNLDPLLASGPTTPPPAAKPAKAPQLDLKNIALQNATLRYTQLRKDGSRMVSEVASVNFNLDQLRNGQASRLTLAADLKTEAGQTAGAATNDLVQAKLDATVTVRLSADLLPTELGLKAGVSVGRAQGLYSDLAGLTAALNGDMTPTDMRELALNFAQNGEALGKIRASGPLLLEKREGKVKVEISAIDRKVLNFAGAKSGFDFGNTRIDSTAEITLSQGARLIAATGRLDAQQLSVRPASGSPTVPLDLSASYDVTVDQNAQSALLNAFTLTGTQQQRPLLRAALTQPMNISWSTNASTNAVGDAALDLAVTDLNLADWRAFVPDLNASGKVGLKLNVLSQLGGQKLTTKLDARVDDFAATAGTNKIQSATVEVLVSAQVNNLQQVTLDNFKLGLALKGQPTLLASSSRGTCNLATGDADLDARLELAPARVLALAPVPGLELQEGKVRFTGRVTQSVKAEKKSTNTVQTAAGELVLADLTGKYQNFKLDRLGLAVNSDVLKSNSIVQLRTLRGQLVQAGAGGGAFDISGSLNLATTTAQFVVKLADVNQNVLAPFAAPSLNGAQLASVSVNSTLAAAYDPKGAATARGDLQIANLLVNDPQKKLPAVPFTATLTLDAAQEKDVVKLKELKGRLAQGDKPAGAFDVTASFDLKKTSGQAALKLDGVNENLLGHVLAAALGNKRLVSGAVSATATATVESAQDAAVKAELQIANLLVNDPEKKLPETPLSLRLALDGSMKKQVLDLRELLLALSPTPRAKNELKLSGKVDLTDTNATKLNLKLAADALDVTPFYDLFDNPQAKADEKKPAEPAKPAAPQTEPTAMKLPLRDSTVDVSIGRFFLREMAVENFIATAKMDNNRVTVKPLSLSVNGVGLTASADANLDVPGYQYDFALATDRIQLEPLVATFAATIPQGAIKGDAMAKVAIRGAGVTGESLQKNLSGNINFSMTNGAIQLGQLGGEPKSPLGKLGKVLTSGVLAFIGPVVGIPDILQPPVQLIAVDAAIGNGTVNLTRFVTQSPAVVVEAQGSVQLASILTNSPMNVPVEVWLPTNYARRFAGSQFPEGSAFGRLTHFVDVLGTVGTPEVKVQKTKLVGSAVIGNLENIGGVVGGKTGDTLKNVGGALNSLFGGGKPAPKSDAPATNAPPANAPTNKPASPLDGLLNPFFKKK